MSASKVRMGQAFVEIGADTAKLFRSLSAANARIGKFASGLRSLGTRMAGIGTAMAAPIALAGRQFSMFDDAIRATAAVSGAAGSDLQALNDRARQLGESTSFTAVQVANLMTELGRAGFAPAEINAMTAAVLDLSRATGTDATLASGIMAATIRQFGLEAGDAARAADVLTKAANATFNTVEGLGESLKYAGPVAKSLGMSLEDTVAVLGVLGNVGIQGSEAGTALRRLSVIAAGAGQELQAIFGVSNTDAAGQLKPLVQVLDEINTVTAGMPVAERTAKMAQAFGLLGITSANVLSQTAGGVTELATKLRAAGGTSAVTAKQMDAGLGGSARIALSAVEGLSISVGDALAPALQKLLAEITAIVGGLTRFVKENQALVVAATQAAAAVVGVGVASYALGLALGAVSAVAGVAIAAFSSIVATTIAMAAGFVGLIAKVVAFKVASVAAAVTAAAAWAAVNLPFVALGVVVAAVAADLFMVHDGVGLVRSAVGGLVGTLSKAAQAFFTIKDIGVTAFREIAQSIKDGDVAGAMRVAMDGLRAAFTIGSSAFLNAVDEWGVNLLNAFDFYISSIPFLRFLGPDQYKFSVFGDSTSGNDANTRADARFADMNTRQAARQVAAQQAVAGFGGMVQGRQNARSMAADNASRATHSAVAARMLAASLAGPAPGSFEADIAAAIGNAPDPFAEMQAEFAARQARQQELFAQQRRMAAEAASQAEVAGTFSSSAVSGMGFGSSLQQQMADYAKRTAEGVERIAEEGLAAAIA
jgi:TP901 family phage tail tape measure protein